MVITPDNIKQLDKNEIFVFGSNKYGNHDGGAARFALNRFGAIYGQSYGLQGQSFGINTMSGIKTMEIEINQFIEYAKKNTEKTFLVTELGCGIAGHTPEEIAPLFKNAFEIKNISLPRRFWIILNEM